eukprot:15449014-Alexandrium_andersonii.AAC.1
MMRARPKRRAAGPQSQPRSTLTTPRCTSSRGRRLRRLPPQGLRAPLRPPGSAGVDARAASGSAVEQPSRWAAKWATCATPAT